MKKLILIALFMLSCGVPDPIKRPKDFTSGYGIDVYIGQRNTPTLQQVDEWTKEIIDFWVAIKPDLRLCMYKHIYNVSAYFYDEDSVVAPDGVFIATAGGHTIHISNGPYAEVRGSFVHELSHVIVAYCFGRADSHEFFDEVNLCSLDRYC